MKEAKENKNNKLLNEIKELTRELSVISKKSYISDEIKTILDKTTKTQLRKEHYKGKKEIRDLKLIGQDEPVDLGLVAIWQSGDVEYFIKQTDLAKLKNQNPKFYVSQDKNIRLLLGLTELQQFNKPNDEKKAEASFTLKEYAKLRGYTEKEIKAGGKFFDELKRDLITGACTTYRINEITINGKKYIAHGIPNFYILLEPKNPKGKWQIKFNTFYAESILKILKGEAKQYFTHYLKEIADRKTTEKPYLHFFYNQLVYRKRKGEATMPKKIVNLLKEMGVAEKFLKRPKKCFDILKECLVYFSTNYPEELESVDFSNNFSKEKSLPLTNLKNLKNFKYKDFKELLKPMGVKDIRNAFISFYRKKKIERELLPAPEPQDNSELINQIDQIFEWVKDEWVKDINETKMITFTTKRELPAPEPPENRELIKQILEWLDRNIDWTKMTTLTREGTEKFLKDCLGHLGFDRLNDLFRQEAQMTYPNAVRFLTKTLPAELKEKQKERDFKAQYRLNSYSDEEIKRFLSDF